MTWQPISTAPRDAVTPILVYDPCERDGTEPFVAYWDRFTGGGWRDSAYGDICHPTHWMPLPDPPKETA